MNNELYHIGIPRKSGRYPWGSGKRPYQSIGGEKRLSARKRAESMSDEELDTFNKRKAKENLYVKNVRDSQDKRNSKLDAANEIGRTVNSTVQNVRRSVNEAYAEQHKMEKQQIDLSELSDEELRRIVNRMQMEQNYRNLSPAVISKGEKQTKDALSVIGDITDIASAGINIAVNIKKLRGLIP